MFGIAAPVAGRIADRSGPHLVILLGAGLTLAAWLVFGVWQSIAGLIVGVILLDFWVQSALVSNQHIVYAPRPEARARLNTIFMGAMFSGGAVGSAAATWVWIADGWTAVTPSWRCAVSQRAADPMLRREAGTRAERSLTPKYVF